MKSNTLTIIVDMQNDFITGSLANPKAESLIENMAKFISEAEKNNEVVVFTLDTHKKNYLNTQEGKKLPIEHCIINTEGHKVNDILLNASKNKIQLLKPTFGMKQNRWSEIIKKYFGDKSNLSNIKLVGTCTSICVCSNALLLKSLLPEVEITVYPDLCACVSEESHNAAILVMKMNQINIVNYF